MQFLIERIDPDDVAGIREAAFLAAGGLIPNLK